MNQHKPISAANHLTLWWYISPELWRQMAVPYRWSRPLVVCDVSANRFTRQNASILIFPLFLCEWHRSKCRITVGKMIRQFMPMVIFDCVKSFMIELQEFIAWGYPWPRKQLCLLVMRLDACVALSAGIQPIRLSNVLSMTWNFGPPLLFKTFSRSTASTSQLVSMILGCCLSVTCSVFLFPSMCLLM